MSNEDLLDQLCFPNSVAAAIEFVTIVYNDVPFSFKALELQTFYLDVSIFPYISA